MGITIRLIEEKPKRIQKRSPNMAGIRIGFENGLTPLEVFDIIIMVVWTIDPTNHLGKECPKR